jgi:hypothetical protein
MGGGMEGKTVVVSRASPQHERYTGADLALMEGKVSMRDSHATQKRGSVEVEAEEVISAETEKSKACWVRTSSMKTSTQGKLSV